jgi:predicted enzyme related to lactoylglutathione lyase
MVSAVVFAKDLRKVAAFYTRVCSAEVKNEDAHHADLDCGGFQLIVHQIPEHYAKAMIISDPPRRREHGAVRLDFPIADVAASRAVARALGGEIDDRPPPWAGSDVSFRLGYDPEGNVFGAQPA